MRSLNAGADVTRLSRSVCVQPLFYVLGSAFSAPHQPEGDHDGHDDDQDDQDDQEDLGEAHSVSTGCAGVDRHISGGQESELLHLSGDGDLSVGDGLSVEGDDGGGGVTGCDLDGDVVVADGQVVSVSGLALEVLQSETVDVDGHSMRAASRRRLWGSCLR